MSGQKCQTAHPEFCRDVTWTNVSWHLLWLPLCALGISFLFVMPVLRMFWTMGTDTRLVRFLRRMLGNVDSDVVQYEWLVTGFFVIELILSLWFAAGWTFRVYTHSVTYLDRLLERVFCVFFLFAYFVTAARNDFRQSCAFQPGAIITVLTVVPVFTRSKNSGNETALWFSFGYLRIYNSMVAYQKIESTGFLRYVSEMKRGYALTVLRMTVLVVIFACTVFALEILGDPPGMEDKFITTGMGDISVAQMTYWIVTTISTVGYGDFSPSTFLARMFTIVTIVVGVYFFSTEINTLAELHKLQSSGKGRYNPRRHINNVVLLGGGVRDFSSVVKSLLDELYQFEHRSSHMGWPSLSFMSSVEQPAQLRTAVEALPRKAQQLTKYFMGDPTDIKDMERLRLGQASLIMIIANTQAPNRDNEDQTNILRALAIRNTYPEVNLRLMLLRPAGRMKAVLLGIRPSNCFSLNELKSGILALSCCCRGWSTLITHFLISSDSEEAGEEGNRNPMEQEGWFTEYKRGRDMNIYGFSIATEGHAEGKTFQQLASEAATRGVILLAVQVDGYVVLNPTNYVLRIGDNVFAIAPSSKHLKTFGNFEDWGPAFLKRQSYAQDKSYSRSSSNLSLKLQNQFPSIPSTPTKSNSKTVIENGSHSLDELSFRAQCIANAGGHYILAILAGNPWQQMQAFLRLLRSDQLPYHAPIIVLASLHPGMAAMLELFSEYQQVALMRADGPAAIHDLAECGMMQAKCIVLFAGNAGEASTSDRRMLDGHGVTLLASIEAEFSREGVRDVAVILELHQQESINYLHRFPNYEQPPNGVKPRYDPKESYINHPRFASGAVWTGGCLGALVARAYYTPGFIELMEALVLGPSTGQLSVPFQIRVPLEFASATYGELVQSFLFGEHSAICLGLYRKCWPNAGVGASYLMSNPPVDMELRNDDLIIAIGPYDFWQNCLTSGLIEGASQAVADDLKAALNNESARSLHAMESSQPSESQLELARTQDLLNESLARQEGLKSRLAAKQDELADALKRQLGLEAKLRVHPMLSTPQEQTIPSAPRSIPRLDASGLRPLRETRDLPPGRCWPISGTYRS